MVIFLSTFRIHRIHDKCRGGGGTLPVVGPLRLPPLYSMRMGWLTGDRRAGNPLARLDWGFLIKDGLKNHFHPSRRFLKLADWARSFDVLNKYAKCGQFFYQNTKSRNPNLGPSAQWNLRGGRWSSAEYCTNKKKKIPQKIFLKRKEILICYPRYRRMEGGQKNSHAVVPLNSQWTSERWNFVLNTCNLSGKPPIKENAPSDRWYRRLETKEKISKLSLF